MSYFSVYISVSFMGIAWRRCSRLAFTFLRCTQRTYTKITSVKSLNICIYKRVNQKAFVRKIIVMRCRSGMIFNTIIATFDCVYLIFEWMDFNSWPWPKRSFYVLFHCFLNLLEAFEVVNAQVMQHLPMHWKRIVKLLINRLYHCRFS